MKVKGMCVCMCLITARNWKKVRPNSHTCGSTYFEGISAGKGSPVPAQKQKEPFPTWQTMKIRLVIQPPKSQNIPPVLWVGRGLDIETDWSLVGLGIWGKVLLQQQRREEWIPYSAVLTPGCSLDSTGRFIKPPDAQNQASIAEELERRPGISVFKKSPG